MQPLTTARYPLGFNAEGACDVTAKDAGGWTFRPGFTVLMSLHDPKLAASFGFQLTGRTVDGRTPGSETVLLEK